MPFKEDFSGFLIPYFIGINEKNVICIKNKNFEPIMGTFRITKFPEESCSGACDRCKIIQNIQGKIMRLPVPPSTKQYLTH